MSPLSAVNSALPSDLQQTETPPPGVTATSILLDQVPEDIDRDRRLSEQSLLKGKGVYTHNTHNTHNTQLGKNASNEDLDARMARVKPNHCCALIYTSVSAQHAHTFSCTAG